MLFIYLCNFSINNEGLRVKTSLLIFPGTEFFPRLDRYYHSVLSVKPQTNCMYYQKSVKREDTEFNFLSLLNIHINKVMGF